MKSNEVAAISRTIGACKRCRVKKIKCSQHFPRCAGCQKANADCVSLDPVTGRDVSRSYVVALEEQVEQLKQELAQLRSGQNNHGAGAAAAGSVTFAQTNASNSPVVSLEHSPGPASTSAFSFSKLVDTALQFKDQNSSVSSASSDNNGRNSTASNTTGVRGAVTMTPSPSVNGNTIDPTTTAVVASSGSNSKPATVLLPPKQQALDLISLYFSQANGQYPIFHRATFLNNYFQPIYGQVPQEVSFASTYTGINFSMLENPPKEEDTWNYIYTNLLDEAFNKDPDIDVLDFVANLKIPQKFSKALYFLNITFAIASSVWLLQFDEQISDSFKSTAMKFIDDVYQSEDKLEVMQAMLTHTLYSLMRPCTPGVWYLLGSTLRMCVDLELHKEEKYPLNLPFYLLDLRRKLFWCCYSLDRQICVYLNRPFGIPEESINVKFPSLLDDSFITPDTEEPLNLDINQIGSSYKLIAISMFKVRLLQAELQSILHERKEIPRKFTTFKQWLEDISFRISKWESEVPKNSQQMNCDFNIGFFSLNYNHCRVMLHGLSPVRYDFSQDDMIQLADASIGMILTFLSLWETKSLNHTWAATQNVFMAGTSYLYAIFHNKGLQLNLKLKDFNGISQAVEIVLASLIDKCNAARECLEVYQILSRAVSKLIFPDPNNEKNLKSELMSRIPSAEQVKTLQPGGNLNPNMKKLLASIPTLLNNIYIDSNKRKLDYEEIQDEQTLKRHLVETNGPMLTLPTYDLDLDKFFEQVQKQTLTQTQTQAQTQRNSLLPAASDTNNSNGSMFLANDYDDNTNVENKKVYKMIYETGIDSIWDQYFGTPFGEE